MKFSERQLKIKDLEMLIAYLNGQLEHAMALKQELEMAPTKIIIVAWHTTAIPNLTVAEIVTHRAQAKINCIKAIRSFLRDTNPQLEQVCVLREIADWANLIQSGQPMFITTCPFWTLECSDNVEKLLQVLEDLGAIIQRR